MLDQLGHTIHENTDEYDDEFSQERAQEGLNKIESIQNIDVSMLDFDNEPIHKV